MKKSTETETKCERGVWVPGGRFSRWEIFIMFGSDPVERDKCNLGKRMDNHRSTDPEKVRGDGFQCTKGNSWFSMGTGMFLSMKEEGKQKVLTGWQIWWRDEVLICMFSQ